MLYGSYLLLCIIHLCFAEVLPTHANLCLLPNHYYTHSLYTAYYTTTAQVCWTSHNSLCGKLKLYFPSFTS